MVDNGKLAYRHRREETLRRDVPPKGRKGLVTLVKFTRGANDSKMGPMNDTAHAIC